MCIYNLQCLIKTRDLYMHYEIEGKSEDEENKVNASIGVHVCVEEASSARTI